MSSRQKKKIIKVSYFDQTCIVTDEAFELTYNNFQVSLLETVSVMRGSCVTVRCLFEIPSQYENNLNENCGAKWVNMRESNPQVLDTNAVTGNLTEKNCTTTFSNMQPAHTNTYYFRLECNDLKYTFKTAGVKIDVKDNFPAPTLTPSTLEVKDGDSVSLTCSAPAPCLSNPPNLTWTPTLGSSQETLQENQDKTLVKTSVLNFTASYLHDGEKISCTSIYKRQDGNPDASFSTEANILCKFIFYFLKSEKGLAEMMAYFGQVMGMFCLSYEHAVAHCCTLKQAGTRRHTASTSRSFEHAENFQTYAICGVSYLIVDIELISIAYRNVFDVFQTTAERVSKIQLLFNGVFAVFWY
uniref:Ig-like domain-containing protein n=1 Tax=Cyprinodon variegatus TaxID=28743 RepID=A0A3Q2D3M3_CYPVA